MWSILASMTRWVRGCGARTDRRVGAGLKSRQGNRPRSTRITGLPNRLGPDEDAANYGNSREEHVVDRATALSACVGLSSSARLRLFRGAPPGVLSVSFVRSHLRRLRGSPCRRTENNNVSSLGGKPVSLPFSRRIRTRISHRDVMNHSRSSNGTWRPREWVTPVGLGGLPAASSLDRGGRRN
jgi:hypothetical protein